MLLYLIVDRLYGFFYCFKGLFEEVQESAYNLMLKFSFIVDFF